MSKKHCASIGFALPTALLTLVFSFCSWRDLVFGAFRVSREWRRTRKVVAHWPKMYPQEFLAAMRHFDPGSVRSVSLRLLLPMADVIAPRLARCTGLHQVTLTFLLHSSDDAQLFIDALQSPGLSALTVRSSRMAESRFENPAFEGLRQLSLKNQRLRAGALVWLAQLRVLETECCEVYAGSLPWNLEQYSSSADTIHLPEVVRVAASLRVMAYQGHTRYVRDWSPNDLFVLCRGCPRLESLTAASRCLPNTTDALKELAHLVLTEFPSLRQLELTCFDAATITLSQ
jgi:hypothetical protein